ADPEREHVPRVEPGLAVEAHAVPAGEVRHGGVRGLQHEPAAARLVELRAGRVQLVEVPQPQLLVDDVGVGELRGVEPVPDLDARLAHQDPAGSNWPAGMITVTAAAMSVPSRSVPGGCTNAWICADRVDPSGMLSVDATVGPPQVVRLPTLRTSSA